MAEVKLKDKTVLRSLGLGGFFGGGAEGMVDVKDGRIVRIRPLRYGWKYGKEEVRQWRMSKNGKSIEPPWKSLPGPFSLAYKKRVYSANRITYPLKRIDWDPKGERNTQNRGTSKYVRISWDQASSIISASERSSTKPSSNAFVRILKKNVKWYVSAINGVVLIKKLKNTKKKRLIVNPFPQIIV